MALHTFFEIEVIFFNSRVFQVTKISGKNIVHFAIYYFCAR